MSDTSDHTVEKLGQSDSTEMSSAKTGQQSHTQSDLVNLITTLKKQSQNVRERLVQTRAQLHRPIPPEAAQLINQNAANFMRICTSSVTKTKNNQFNGAKVKSKKEVELPSRKQNKNTSQNEMEALIDLVRGLTSHNPEVKEHALKLVQKNDKLARLNLFNSINELPTCSRNEQYTKPGNANHKNNKNVPNSQTGGKRNRQRKKKVDQTTLKSELEALRKYINNITEDYLGRELPEELQFKGNFSDLEQHAENLVAAGIGRIVEEQIRINRKNNRQAFISMSNDREGLERDGIVLLPVGRRYAFEGDIVRAFVLNPGTVNNDDRSRCSQKTICGNNFTLHVEELSEGADSQESDDLIDSDAGSVTPSDNCPKAFVISIIKQTELREIVGTISFSNPVKFCNEQYFYKFKPYDMRMPMVYIPLESCTSIIAEQKTSDVCGIVCLARILEVQPGGHCIAELIQAVGQSGNLEVEIRAILLNNSLHDIVPYKEEFIEMFANDNLPISATDLEQRTDLRNRCIFTIDPLTARDLDDAVSLEKLDEDEYEVGVHISDVSHYLQESTELDNIVKQRSTSVYLVNEVIHMLPPTLCLKCSLLPGVDKFTFSVFWKMSSTGEIIGEPKFSRTVINSCSQFAYEHAQKIIDNPNEKFGNDDFPTICNGFQPNDIVLRIRLLYEISCHLRKRRFDHGALSINNPKIRFIMDPDSGEPQLYQVEKIYEANQIIEEFMLLANQTVAHFIYDAFPNTAILRNHAPPFTKSLKALRDKLNILGIELDISSAKAIQLSKQNMSIKATEPAVVDVGISQLLMKSMARAKYFCSEGKTKSADLWHYALSIPIYTHFTSPIRRYPDILVHRLLAAALNYCPAPKRTPEELHELIKMANERKYNAKAASDESMNLFFKRYVAAKHSILARAVVIEIYTHMTNVATLETGHVISINHKLQKIEVDTRNVPYSIMLIDRNSKVKTQKLQLFSVVQIKLEIHDQRLCGFFVSCDSLQQKKRVRKRGKKKKNNIQQNQNSHS